MVCSRVRMSTVLSRGRDRFPRPAGGSAGAAVVRGTYVRYRRRLPRGHSPSARGHPSPRPDGESMTGRTVAIARTTDPPPVGLIPQAADVRQLSGWGQGAMSDSDAAWKLIRNGRFHNASMEARWGGR